MDLNFLRISYPAEFDDIKFPENLRVWVCAPHPDDFDAVAVTLQKFQEKGAEIFLSVMSSGASGVEDSYCDPPTKENKEQTREEEQLESCRVFGLPEENIKFLHLVTGEDGQIADLEENYHPVKAVFDELEPDVVILPHGKDTNFDHQLGWMYIQEMASSRKKPLIALYNRDPKTIDMREDIFTQFGDSAAKWKARLLLCHQSQHMRNLSERNIGFAERILQVNEEIAERASMEEPFAEAFELKIFT
ncbi:PIG-L family deacetylase [Lentisphaerota bacterium ZTH]|nr:PIG-L family deacetylase [Lentisphaerota bacterium]WET05626.1 PIG-L family deacetylase [Lentisphaerota bacterium ZTH]